MPKKRKTTKNNKWVVHTHLDLAKDTYSKEELEGDEGEDLIWDNTCEVSVLRDDYALGKNSYGWDEWDRKHILLSVGSEITEADILIATKAAENMAKIVADALNEKELQGG